MDLFNLLINLPMAIIFWTKSSLTDQIVFSASIGRSLLKTKHQAVFVNCDQSVKPVSCNRVKVKLYDLCCHNIDRLRYMTATHDWSNYFVCNDIQHLYDMFIDDVHALISNCIPVKHVTMSSRDPPYVTPLVKSMLRKRYRLRRSGRTAEADQLLLKLIWLYKILGPGSTISLQKLLQKK